MLEQYIKEATFMITESSKMSPLDKREYLQNKFSDIYKEAKNSISINDIIKIYQLENKLSDRFIPVEPILESSRKETGSSEQILEQIVYYSRKRFQETYNCNIKNDSLRDRSKDMVDILKDVLDTLNIIYTVIDLGKKIEIYSHYVVIVLINNELYLIDLTYQQFFILGYNFIDRYYDHPNGVKTCEIGGRMIPKYFDTAKFLIEKGYLKCKSMSFKEYMDAFMSFSENDLKENYNDYLEFLLSDLKEIKDKSSNKILSII